MLLPELQSLASSLGIQGTGRLRKGQLIAAIQNVQNGGSPALAVGTSTASAGSAGSSVASTPLESVGATETPSDAARSTPAASSAAVGAPSASEPTAPSARTRGRRASARGIASPGDQQELLEVPARNADQSSRSGARSGDDGAPRGREDRRDRQQGDRADRQSGDRSDRQQGERTGRAGTERGDRTERADRTDRADRGERQQGGERQSGRQNDRSQNDRAQSDRSQNDRSQGDRAQNDRSQNGAADEDEFGNRRRGRFRERGRNRGRAGQVGGAENEPMVREDDVLVPVAGILDVLDNYAFIRTSGYLTGSTDVYVSLAQVRRHGLRRGDAITGVVRAPQEGEQRRDKYNALVRLDAINGMDPEEARNRPEFHKLTPLYPQDRLRMETEPNILTTRVIDLVMPIGKGQRALIVSPPKAGKTMVLQAIANAITTNNPECHLMVVLVDERPEEVTDMQRSVKGEVIASTFDRPPADHTNVAELSIERAKRLVELGHDVVVLLDSITRLGRAYNLAAPASGRILSGGVDSTALYPPKRFLGAARNIENGGSLTIIATALVETGSTMDTVIFEEFKGTGNAELKLDRKIADKRIFPAVDVDSSSTRKDEILLAPDELGIMHKLRRVLHTREPQQAIELLLGQLKQTRTNYEFLMQISKTTPGQD
jgi:transcription termination factor Rho